MFVERFFLSCVIATALAAGGCAAGASNSQDPPIEPVDASGGAASGKKSPDVYWVKLETTKGDVDIEVHRDWSPHGADRFYELVEDGYFNDNRIFRVIPGFVAQVGIAANPSTTAKWKSKNIPDDHLPAGDPNLQSNKRGYVSFAKTQAANSRTTQFFINTGDNSGNLDGMGFTPFGIVLNGLPAAEIFYAGYREGPGGPRQDQIESKGNAYLNDEFPKLDSIKKATLLPKKPEPTKKPAE
jgi:peptidyl-prolyl cis-trans isomerase A (cyclophilin A)